MSKIISLAAVPAVALGTAGLAACSTTTVHPAAATTPAATSAPAAAATSAPPSSAPATSAPPTNTGPVGTSFTVTRAWCCVITGYPTRAGRAKGGPPISRSSI
jgi:hypothetical protein